MLRNLPLFALTLLATAPASAETLFDRVHLAVVGDIRFALADAEPSWRNGGTGKLRFDGTADGGVEPHATIGEAHLLWTPSASALRIHVDARYQPGQDVPFGINEAWVQWKPEARGVNRLSARAGLFYPPVSLEHDGPAWTVSRTITPSAINSWIAEEVKVAAFEVRVDRSFGGHAVALTAALFNHNDTSGTLLTYRGWALHDITSVGFEEQPLPPLSGFAGARQAPYTTPVLELDHRAGYYVRLDWRLPEKLALNLFWYDNRGDGTAVTPDKQWSWDTRFFNLGATLDVDSRTQILAQAMLGNTRMGYPFAGQQWFDVDFRALYVLASRNVGQGLVSARVDWFGTRDRTLQALDNNDEHGWALTGAFSHPLGAHATLVVEALHVGSNRPGRAYAGRSPYTAQNQLQAALRLGF